MEKILVIAPHHDDEVIGCGGSIAYANKKGYLVDVVYMTSGYAGIPETTDINRAIEIREDEAKLAGKILGVYQQYFFRNPDRALVYSIDNIKQLIALIRSIGYSWLFFPHKEEKDHEHQVVYQIAKEAVWLSSKRYFPELGDPVNIKNILLYEVWSPLHHFNIKIDISDFLELKKQALLSYRSQFTERQVNGILGLNMYRSAMTGSDKKGLEVFKYLDE